MIITGNKMYWVLGRHKWNKQVFDETIKFFPGEWRFISAPEELTLEAVQQDQPEKLFFMHWSWKVPAEITDQYECIAFHPSDLPYGRGGSPVQHQILEGHDITKLTAFRLTQELDAGPIYMKDWLNLTGTAESIYVDMSHKVADMIEWLITHDIDPKPQNKKLEAKTYLRRTPYMSRIPVMGDETKMYDFIRMLDAEGYPRAYLDLGTYHYEFSHAVLYADRVEAHVVITENKK